MKRQKIVAILKAIKGLIRRGKTNPFISGIVDIVPEVASKALPVNAPINACVVEIGKPKLVAKNTVKPAPPATAIIKGKDCIKASGAKPLPENLVITACA